MLEKEACYNLPTTKNPSHEDHESEQSEPRNIAESNERSGTSLSHDISDISGDGPSGDDESQTASEGAPTYVHIKTNMIDGNMIIGFRGTGGDDIKDWLTNLNFELVQYHQGNEDVLVHKGFFERATSIIEGNPSRPALQPPLKTRIKKYFTPPQLPKKITFTGHSLGGALAQLVYLSLGEDQELKDSNCQLSCITFGAPMIGNLKLKEELNESGKAEHMHHYVMTIDIVPAMLYVNEAPISKKLVKYFFEKYVTAQIDHQVARARTLEELHNRMGEISTLINGLGDQVDENNFYTAIGNYQIMEKLRGDTPPDLLESIEYDRHDNVERMDMDTNEGQCLDDVLKEALHHVPKVGNLVTDAVNYVASTYLPGGNLWEKAVTFSGTKSASEIMTRLLDAHKIKNYMRICHELLPGTSESAAAEVSAETYEETTRRSVGGTYVVFHYHRFP